MIEEFPTKLHRDKALRHLRHEYMAMNYALDRLLLKDYRDVHERTLLIESCTLHARTLYFFLIRPKPPLRDQGSQTAFDVWIGDYFVDPDSQLAGKDDAPSLRSFAERAGKFLAHLSYRRDLDLKLTVHDLANVVVEIDRRLAEFRKYADNDVDWSFYDAP